MPNDEVFDPNAAAEAPEAASKTNKRNRGTTAPLTENLPELSSDDGPSAGEVEDLIGSTGPAIEDDVPLPSSNAGRKSSFSLTNFPFDKLKVGQSFAVLLREDGKTDSGITVKTILAQAKKAVPSGTFVSQVSDDKTTVRFWRKK